MMTDVNDPMFDAVQPGCPGWFYTREPREETLRRLVRKENGELWIASGPMPVRLDGADLEVVGPVPPWQATINDPAQNADDSRRAELAAENMIIGEQVRTLKAAMLALLQGRYCKCGVSDHGDLVDHLPPSALLSREQTSEKFPKEGREMP